MINSKSISALAAVPLLLASCIAAEKENTECDIEAVSLHFDNPIEIFYHEYDTLREVISSETEVIFTIRNYANVQGIPTTLRHTPGSSVYTTSENGEEVPFLNGSVVDFSDEQVHHFRVVSEDKMWSRDYNISVVHDKPSEGNLFIDFESYYLDPTGKFYIWDAPDVFTDGVWKNGNPGFKISKSSAMPMEYPSVPIAGGGPDGSACVKLETLDTGPFGRMVNMRLASGSMFNGIFDVGNALKDALRATQFGTPFTHKPILLRSWLRYEPGEVYQDRMANPMEGIVDEPDIYFVLYRNEDEQGNKVVLDGIDVLTNPHIVGYGRLPHRFNPDGAERLTDDPIHGITTEWKEIDIPMEYRSEVDETILENKGYSLVISFASSWQGGDFMGALGSKLYLDNVQLFCE